MKEVFIISEKETVDNISFGSDFQSEVYFSVEKAEKRLKELQKERGETATYYGFYFSIESAKLCE